MLSATSIKNNVTRKSSCSASSTTDLSSDSTSDTGKDSGCETQNQNVSITGNIDVTSPAEEDVLEQIARQVEFYFSDVNILRDAFLLKHVRRNKEGYVSLKLITSFKRVKHLTKDWRKVALAIQRKSQLLIINPDGNKVRRLQPLPSYDETIPSRTIIVTTNLPQITIEIIAELFTQCGEISSIRIQRPGSPVPSEIRQFLAKNPLIKEQIYAIIEFTKTESVDVALDHHSDSIKTYKLHHQVQEKKNTKKTLTDMNKSYHLLRRGVSVNNCCHHHCDETALKRRFSVDYHRKYFDSCCHTHCTFDILRRMSSCSLTSSSSSSADSNNSRRASTNSQSSLLDFTRSRRSSSTVSLSDNVVRMPKGPDGTCGFKLRVFK